MKRYLFLSLLACVLICQAQFPVAKPDFGDGRIVVCGQNLKNYFAVNLDAERPDYHDASGLESKTSRIVRAFLYLDADIYSLCEMECQEGALAYLTNAMNAAAGEDIYDYVNDHDYYLGTAGNEQIKSCFIYRKDMVAPFGNNSTASTQTWYRYTMRLQGFEELSTGERFVLSMNHFKAKDSTYDQGNSKRERNAQDLLTALRNYKGDPDVLIMGDLNCVVGEQPLQYLENAGYSETLLRYDPGAYSYVYYSDRQLIDHVYANESMTEQVDGAGVFHVNTGTNRSGSYWYSDHDPYLVSLNLNVDEPVGDVRIVDYTQDFKEGFGDFTVVTPKGSIHWLENDKYGATINGYNRTGEMESWLVSGEFDLSNVKEATLEFRHNLYYDNSQGKYRELQTLWYSTDYVGGDPDGATWHQLEIPAYGVKEWLNCEVALPKDAMKRGFRYAFRYEAPNGADANYWEIDSTSLKGVGVPVTSVEGIRTEGAGKSAARKYVKDGRLYIRVGEKVYDGLGRELQQEYDAECI